MTADFQLTGNIEADPTARIPTFRADIGPHRDCVVFHGNFLLAGDITVDNVTRIAITTGRPGCPCGCNAPAQAMMYLIAPEHARAVAAQLVALADRMETAAGDQATALLRKVTGK